MQKTLIGAVLASLFVTAGWCGDTSSTTENNPEGFKIEITASYWNMSPSGTLYGSDTTLNVINDLGFQQNNSTFFGQLVFKPTRKQRIIVEGSPVSVSGSHVATQTFSYNGQQFTYSEQLQSQTSLSYLFAGYQYDFLSGPAGHLGASVGGAYLNGSATITAPQAGITAARSQQIGLPLAGIEFRIFPIPGRSIVDVDGGVRGMDFGSYGDFVEGSINGTVWIHGHIGLQGGYREMTANLQNTGTNLSGRLDIRLKGPVFGLIFKW